MVHDDHAGVKRSSLYVVATPIGNLADITVRALEVLRRVEAIAAEDTRLTSRLLAHYGIVVPLISLHEHNERRAAQQILRLLERGESVALVCDAGTPGISDPGAVAVRLVRDAGFPVVPVPGPNAAVCALSAAGCTAPHFLFFGFLPASRAARRRELAALKSFPYTIIFYEAPHRIVASINDIADAFGPERPITIARELTKLFETIHSCRIGEAAAWLAADAHRIKGEFVLLIEGAAETVTTESAVTRRALEVLLRELPLRQAVKLAAEISGGKRNELYEHALALRK